MLAVNQILQGRYRIIRHLGHGGMGAVYEAVDERFGEPIALKEIVVDSISEKQREIVSRAFEREAKALAKAKHEAVPFVRDYFFELNRQFLVMELVEGEDLGEMLEKRGSPFPLDETLVWMDQLLDALDYLHNLKPPIIHRDIKPQNLKLSVRRRIKLLDFGIARSSDQSSTATITRQTFVGATLNYSPIEQILRVIDQTFREFIILKHKERAEAVLRQDTDVRCDLYALGGTFYHLLTNQIPVESTKRTLDLWEGKADSLLNPALLNPQIPRPIANCLMKALAIEREQRFSSAIEMQLALKGAIAEIRAQAAGHQSGNTQAETIRISTSENLKSGNPTESHAVYAAPTNSIELPAFETQSSFPDLKAIDPMTSSSETDRSRQTSNPELTARSYLTGDIPEQKKVALENPSPVISSRAQDNSGSSNKILWVIPLVLIGFFAVSGIGAAVWLLTPSPPAPAPNKTIVNPVIQTPTPAASPAPTPATPESPVTVPTSTPVESKNEPTKPVAAATPKTRVPAKTPIVKKTPRPQQDPNCVFTNSCK
jgi:serine/threonine protein kinase